TRALFELLTEDLRHLGRVAVQRNAPLRRHKHRHRRCRAETTYDPNLEILEIEWHEIQRIGERPIVGHDYQSARTLPRLVSDMPAGSPCLSRASPEMLPERRVVPVRLVKIEHAGGGEHRSGYAHCMMDGGSEETI